ncbi:hypothetical protein D3C76_1455820 [compost metagenome]
MGVQPQKHQVGLAGCQFHSAERRTVAQIEAKLGVLLAGGRILMGMGGHTRRYPEEDVNLAAALSGHGIQQLQLHEIIYNKAADSGIQRHVDFPRGFVVPVEVDPLRRESGL